MEREEECSIEENEKGNMRIIGIQDILIEGADNRKDMFYSAKNITYIILLRSDVCHFFSLSTINILSQKEKVFII